MLINRIYDFILGFFCTVAVQTDTAQIQNSINTMFSDVFGFFKPILAGIITAIVIKLLCRWLGLETRREVLNRISKNMTRIKKIERNKFLKK